MKKILLLDNGQFISVLESFGYYATSVQSFLELDTLLLRENYDLIILTDIGFLSNEIISCTLSLKQNNLSSLVFVEANNFQLINELANLSIDYEKFPINSKMLELRLRLLLTPEKCRLSEDQMQLIKDPVKMKSLESLISSNFKSNKPTIKFWGKFLNRFKFSKKKTYLDEFHSIKGTKQISDYFDVMNKEGTTDDMIPNGVGHFGYDKTNPIPTNNIFGSNVYLGRLRDKNGMPIKYERLGSTFAKNIGSNPIDIYKISDSNSVELGTIYISPYQKTISQKAPAGLLMG